MCPYPSVLRSDVAPAPAAEGVVVSTSFPRDDMVRVRCAGELDLATTPATARSLTRTCRRLADAPRTADGPVVLEVDLGGVGFLGAAGVGMLVELAVTASGCGVDLVLAGAGRRVRRVLSLTATDHLFDLVEPLRS